MELGGPSGGQGGAVSAGSYSGTPPPNRRPLIRCLPNIDRRNKQVGWPAKLFSFSQETAGGFLLESPWWVTILGDFLRVDLYPPLISTKRAGRSVAPCQSVGLREDLH